MYYKDTSVFKIKKKKKNPAQKELTGLVTEQYCTDGPGLLGLPLRPLIKKHINQTFNGTSRNI